VYVAETDLYAVQFGCEGRFAVAVVTPHITKYLVTEVNPCVRTAQRRPPSALGSVTPTDHRMADQRERRERRSVGGNSGHGAVRDGAAVPCGALRQNQLRCSEKQKVTLRVYL
jgi:hypothetical protein